MGVYTGGIRNCGKEREKWCDFIFILSNKQLFGKLRTEYQWVGYRNKDLCWFSRFQMRSKTCLAIVAHTCITLVYISFSTVENRNIISLLLRVLPSFLHATRCEDFPQNRRKAPAFVSVCVPLNLILGSYSLRWWR